MGLGAGGHPGAAYQARAPSHTWSKTDILRLDVHDGEISVTDVDDSEMRDLRVLAARLGRDPLVIQGPGGNISLKCDGVMWVKASGTWMAEAVERSILIPIDVVAVLDGLAAGDPACETCDAFVRRDLTDLKLRPSIETTCMPVFPRRGGGLCICV